MQITAKKYHKNSIGVCWEVANLQNVGFTFKRKIHIQPQLMIQQICNHKNLFVFLYRCCLKQRLQQERNT